MSEATRHLPTEEYLFGLLSQRGMYPLKIQRGYAGKGGPILATKAKGDESRHMAERRWLVLAAGLVCLWPWPARPARAQAAAPAPRAIIRRMIDRYARASSYQDTGEVRLVAADPSSLGDAGGRDSAGRASREAPLVSFRTYFARPRMFRFDWKGLSGNASREATTWSDGRRVYSWAPEPASSDGSFTLSREASLSSAMEGARGSSAGAAYNVTSLLMRGAGPDSFADYLGAMKELTLLGDEVLDGETCYVIRGKIFGHPWMLWVGKDSRLLRKTRTLYVRGSFHQMVETGAAETAVAEEVHRDIKIDAPLPREVFRYRPQLQSGDADLTR